MHALMHLWDDYMMLSDFVIKEWQIENLSVNMPEIGFMRVQALQRLNIMTT